jgi:hypothetical protein
MDLADSFLSLIYNIEPSAVILSAYGLLLIAASFIKTQYGLYTVFGALCLSASIAVRMLGGGNIAQAFIMLFIMLFLITVIFLLAARFSKYGWILRMPVSPVSEGIKEIRVKKER